MLTDCKRCSLYKYRTHIVKGRGDLPAELLIIGEAPGVSEDATGRASVGRSGKLLDVMLEHAFKSCRERCRYYIVNCVLCRPCDSADGVNRQPTKEEILKCSINVLTIIQSVQPKVIVLAGKIAEQVFEKEFPDAYRIQHPTFILKTGGIFSPYYIQNTINLTKAVKDAVQNQ